VALPRLHLAHLPTPLTHHPELDRLVGAEVWVKRDDMTSGAAAGNKIRKLEWLFAHARQVQSTMVLTCGGVQSNHARATALVAAELGLRALLFLRAADPSQPIPTTGNLLLDRMAGAELRFISPEQYADRDRVMGSAAEALSARGERPYVIPEGGSNGRGALGYVQAMHEIRQQLDHGLAGGPRGFDVVVHACGSGGTAAGVALGAGAFDVAREVIAMAVTGDRATFEAIVARVIDEARALCPDLDAAAPWRICEDARGPEYGVASEEQRRLILTVARRTGLVLDPVYTGKALFGLARLEPRPRRVLFLHTGGLPGLLAQAEEMDSML